MSEAYLVRNVLNNGIRLLDSCQLVMKGKSPERDKYLISLNGRQYYAPRMHLAFSWDEALACAERAQQERVAYVRHQIEVLEDPALRDHALARARAHLLQIESIDFTKGHEQS